MELQKNKEGSTKENPKLKLGPLNEQANEQKFQIT